MAGLAFLFLGAIVALLAMTSAAWGWLWPAAVAMGVGVLYATHAAGGERLREAVPRMFGKRDDGTQRLFVWLVWGPYLAYTWLLHLAARELTGEDASNEVGAGLWVGRRPLARELQSDCQLVVDLCAELPAARGVTTRAHYLCIPALDASAPTARQIDEAVRAIAGAGGPVLVHCAFGHGRSATIAAAALVHRGSATLADVEAKLRAARPRIRLTWGQRRALAEYARRFLPSAGTADAAKATKRP